jgi:hypothetical protein
VTLAVALFGMFFVVLGVTGIVSPARLISFVSRWQSQSGLYFAAGIRILLGAALVFAAPESRAPVYLQVFGGVAILAGVAMPFFGLRRFEAVLGWWRARPAVILRSWCVLVVLIGVSFVWAVFPVVRAS